MKKKLVLLSLFLIVILFVSGCTTGGSFLSYNATNVELSEANFNIVARDVEGYSVAKYLIGISYSSGFLANTLAFVRIGGSEKLYDDAVKSLWKNFKEKHGDSEGKNLLLMNVRYDVDMLNLILYTQTELYLTADVVEFVE